MAHGFEFDNIYQKANSVNLEFVFSLYDLKINSHIKKIKCPFKHHKMGHESTPSLYYYPDTNSFWCFGCKTGSKPIDFVCAMENCSASQAANKLINSNTTFTYHDTEEYDDSKVFLFFSEIRELKKSSDSIEFNAYIENTMANFDYLYDKYKLYKNKEGLDSLITKTKDKIKQFIIENNLCQVQLS